MKIKKLCKHIKETKKYKIYKFTFPNNKHYIGMTSRHIYQRLKGHNDSIKNKIHLPVYNAINKYKIENVQIDLLYETNSFSIINNKEKYFIKLFNSLVPNGYNLERGGYKPPIKKRIDKPQTNKTIRQISETLKEYYLENGIQNCVKAQRIAAENRRNKRQKEIKILIEKLLKQKKIIRTKTISEIVGVATPNVRPYMLRMGYFIGHTNNIRYIYEKN